jgi:flagellar biosynthesis protein FliR
MSLPADLLVDEAFAFLLVFARIGAAMMVLPGFGEPFVLARARLLLALFVSAALTLAIGPRLPPMPGEVATMAGLVLIEVLTGLFVGVAARAILAALHVAGQAIAFQSSLAAAAFFDPNEATQGTLPGNLLTTTGIVLLFATDAHHLMLQALAAGYDGRPAGTAPPLGDMAETLARHLADAFALGIRIAAPLLVVSLLLNLGLGILNRLMPSFQVFFVALPLQMLLAFAVFMLVLGGGLLAFLNLFEDALATLAFGA